MFSKQSVIEEALKLSEADRLEVAEALFESMEGPAEPGAQAAWDREIQKRITEIDANKAKMIPWPEARRQIAGDGRADH